MILLKKFNQNNWINYFSKLLFLLLILSASCTPLRKLKYLQNKEQNDTITELSRETNYKYKIQCHDNLYIKVLSFDEKTYQFFNFQSDENKNINDINLYINSYEVNDSGYIDMPSIGKILIKDLTIQEAKDLIQHEINKYLKQTSLIIKLINYNITVLGEVNKPGKFSIYNESINILEALGLAGDLTEYGNRNKITIVRQMKDNNNIYYLDLTDKKLLESSYYYLMPNDIVYVEPLRAKVFGFRTFPFPLIFSSITTIIVILTFIK